MKVIISQVFKYGYNVTIQIYRYTDIIFSVVRYGYKYEYHEYHRTVGVRGHKMDLLSARI